MTTNEIFISGMIAGGACVSTIYLLITLVAAYKRFWRNENLY